MVIFHSYVSLPEGRVCFVIIAHCPPSCFLTNLAESRGRQRLFERRFSKWCLAVPASCSDVPHFRSFNHNDGDDS